MIISIQGNDIDRPAKIAEFKEVKAITIAKVINAKVVRKIHTYRLNYTISDDASSAQQLEK